MPTIRSGNKRMLVLFFNSIILLHPYIMPHYYLPTLFAPPKGQALSIWSFPNT
jgi:hypothetical protein